MEAACVEETPDDAAVAVEPAKQPRAMGVLCIVLLLLGIAGGFTGAYSFAMTLLAPVLQKTMASLQQVGSPEMREQQQLINAASQDLALRFRTVNLVLSVAHMAVAVGLIYGAVLGLKKSPRAAGVLAMICLAAIVFELAKTAPTIMMQREIGQLMAEKMPAMITASQGKNAPPNAPDFSKILKLAMQVYMAVIFVFTLGWVAFKVILYGFVVSYVSRPYVKAALR